MANFQKIITTLNIAIKQRILVAYVPVSRQNVLFANLLYSEGFIKAFTLKDKFIKVKLFKKPSIMQGKKFTVISQNKKDHYAGYNDFWSHSGACSFFITTHKGIFSVGKNTHGGKLLAASI